MSKKFLYIIAILFLSACQGPVECIDPDNWGNQFKMTVDSKGSNVSQSLISKDYQVSEWSWKYRLDGRDVVMVIDNPVSTKQQTVSSLNCANSFNYSNTWSPIFGDMSTITQDNLDKVPLARFKDKISPKWCTPVADITKDLPVINLPSRLYMGLGLYVNIGEDPINGSMRPSADKMQCGLSNSSGGTCMMHIGDNACDNPGTAGCNTGLFSYGCPTGGAILKPPGKCGAQSCYLYMKILDRYYSDNVGSYTVTFKQGVQKSSPQAITTAVAIVTSKLCVASKQIYINVTKSSLIGYVKYLLILYVMVTGIGFVLGMVSMTNSEFIVRIFKIGLMLQLISDSSWEFFSMYLFNIFQNGVGELTGILFGGSGNSDALASLSSLNSQEQSCIPNLAGFQQFDEAILKMFSFETSRKILSLLVWSPYGFIFIIIIYVLMCIAFIVIAQAILIFIVSYLAISLLIILAPIFLPFMLFKFTEKFTDNWLKQIISYFIQPLVILTFAFFVLTLILNQLQFLVGFRVCWKEWLKIPVFNQSIYAWQKDFDDRKDCLLTPNTIFDFDENGNIKIAQYPGPTAWGNTTCTPMAHSPYNSVGVRATCDPYVCPQLRYLGYPYLDPTKVSDLKRIKELQNGELISFMDMLIFILLIYFIMKFNKVVPLIAKNLADVQGESILSKVASDMTGKAASLASKAAYAPTNMAYQKFTGRKSLSSDFKMASDTVKDAALNNPVAKKVKSIYPGLQTISKAPFTLPGKAASSAVKGTKELSKKIGQAASEGIDRIRRK